MALVSLLLMLVGSLLAARGIDMVAHGQSPAALFVGLGVFAACCGARMGR
jgi:hypothetical protein